MSGKKKFERCAWVNDDPLYIAYHDNEWAVPIYDDQILFEFLILEGMQAGLNWLTILKKREHFRKAFDNFDANLIAQYDENKMESLLNNPGIIRNKLKINSVRTNAQLFLKIQSEYGQFSNYLWQFVNGKPIINRWESTLDIPTETSISQAMSKDLKQRGFKFVGSTICYAFMQAIGMVNDHTVNCFRHPDFCH